MHRITRFLPLMLLLALVAAVWTSGLTRHVSWTELARHQAALVAWTEAHAVTAPALFLAIYAAVVVLSLPIGAWLSIVGGLLFGTAMGGALSVVGATTGAIGLFLVVRSAVAPALVRRGGSLIARIRPALERDGFLYLLAIRLVPAFPFWAVNLAAAACGMRLLPFAGATLLGIMPTTFILASLGDGLGGVLAQGGRPDLAVLFSPGVLLPLCALAGMVLLPVAWRQVRGWRRGSVPRPAALPDA
jgi:uncharacterized membrane protein YdjX (TVP38/TMEM64 family)